jgi:hypothetical protein
MVAKELSPSIGTPNGWHRSKLRIRRKQTAFTTKPIDLDSNRLQVKSADRRYA